MVNYTYESYIVISVESRNDFARERRDQRLSSRLTNKNYNKDYNKNYNKNNRNNRKNGSLKQPGGASCDQRR
mgnify:CR=1 FL=1